MTIHAIGVDPGREGGLALVSLEGGRPTLLGLWALRGDTDSAWYASACIAAREARAMLTAAEVERCVVWVEQPGHEGAPRAGKVNLRNRSETWYRLGNRGGYAKAALYDAGFAVSYEPQPGQWPGAYGKAGKPKRNVVPTGKDKATGGAHRLDEARSVLSGFDAANAVRKGGMVDRAEAALIAGAAALTRRSVEAA